MAWATLCGIPEPLPFAKYHTTILYSRVQLPAAHGLIYDSRKSDEVWECMPIELKLFESRGRLGEVGKAALCLVLSAPQIENIHVQLRAAGGTHDFDDYVPHLTLTYKCPPDFDLTSLPLPTEALLVDQVKAEPLDLEWAEKKKVKTDEKQAN